MPTPISESLKIRQDLKGIAIVIGCSMAIFWPGAMSFGFPGVMAPVWREMFHIGSAATGNVLFFMLVAVGTFMFLVGRWQERYGTRRMIAAGVLGSALSLIIAGYASSPAWLYAWAFIAGISSSFVYIPALTVVQRWYPEKRGLVSGIVSMVFGISAAVTSPLFGGMLASMGYTEMCTAVCAISLVTGLSALYILRSPDAIPARPAGTTGIAGAAEHGVAKAEDVDGGRRSLTVRESLRTRSFWLLWAVWALQGAAGIAMVMLSTAYGLSRGLPLESAVLILMAFNLTNGTGRLISGFMSDVVGRNRTMSIAFFAAAVAYFVLPYSSGLPMLSVLAALVGLSFGTMFSVSAPLVSDCFGLKHFGAIFGLVFTAYGFIAGILGPTLSGYLLDMTGGDFSPVFLYLGSFCVVSGICIRMVAPAHRN